MATKKKGKKVKRGKKSAKKSKTKLNNNKTNKKDRKSQPKEKKIAWLKRIVYFGTLALVFLWLFWGIPLPTKLASQQVPVSTKLFDRKGNLLYEIYTDKRSTPVKIDELPEYVKDATISIEDKDFYRHYGVSFTGVMRAVYKTVVEKKLQGGSTLTQQLIKNALLTPERTVKRKIREFALTLVVETIYTKDQILAMYLNQIPYGGTAYGIGAASELYFGKSAKDLTLAEAALLAGLPAAPSRFSPFGSRPELAKGRQETVLRRMVEDGYITTEAADEALSQELEFVDTGEFEAPHFSLWVKEQLAQKYGESVVERGGLRVTTTLDLDLQNFAQAAVATEVAKLKNYKVGNGAALITRPGTGEILAMVGSKDYNAKDEDGKVNIILASRQPGSSIKPINYSLALLDEKITAATILADVPTCFIVPGTRPYCPRNYDGNFHGPVQVRYALANSYNVPAVRVLALNGIENFIDFAEKMGITTFTEPSNYGLSLTLGGGEVRPFDMAVAFGVLANGGVKQPLTGILKVEDWKGETLEELKPEDDKLAGERIIGPEVPFIISDILKDNSARSAAFGSRSELVVDGHPEVSVKTGTTNDLKDNWTIGYTSDALALTWVGNNDNTPMSGAVSGVSGASPIWNTIIKEVLDKAEEGYYSQDDDGHSWPRQPEGVITASVCLTTGAVPQEGDSCQTRAEFFIRDTIPTQVKGGFQDVHFDNRTGLFINDETPPEFIRQEGHNVIFDPLNTFVCLDCPVSYASQSATVRYPVVIDNNPQISPKSNSEE